MPSHYEPTKAAIEAGKHVYTEWPLGRTTAEAEELAALARAKGVQTAVGLQSRVSPALLYMKDLVAEGYVGEVLSCHADCMRDGALERPSGRTWQRDVTLGANPLTIANGHVIDALRFVVGDFARVSCMLTTQAKQWYETDTKKMVDVTSPDNILVNGKLAQRRGGFGARRGGAVGGRRLSDGDLRARRHARRDRRRVVPARPDAARAGREAQPGARRYADPRSLLVGAAGISPRRSVQRRADVFALRRSDPHRRRRRQRLPTFDTAVDLHRFLDTIRQSSEAGREMEVKT